MHHHSNAAVTRLQPDQPLVAAGYIRVSRQVQAEGHSPDIQREAIKRLARQEGFLLPEDMIQEDHESGGKVSRKGYQRVIQQVEDGEVQAILVYMFDRWGRDGAEWLARARRFDRLGVPIISVQEGRDEGGLIRFIRAGMAEEYSRQLAQRTRPARERSARAGVHCAMAPFGYVRLYPPVDPSGHRPPGRLEPDPATAWIVAELFTRYAAGGWSTPSLALWMNTDPRLPKPRIRHNRDGQVISADQWTSAAVLYLLRNAAYRGAIRYNVEPEGTYDRAAPDDVFTVEDCHPPLVSPELWQAVQERLAAARRHSYANVTQTATGRPVALGSGLLRCAGCGGRMYLNRIADGEQVALYLCGRHLKGAPCAVRGYKAELAHAALLAELRRLRGAPWTPEREQRLLGADGQRSAEVVSLQQALANERTALRNYVRGLALLAQDPTPEEAVEFAAVRAEFTSHVRALEAQVAAASVPVVHITRLRALHERLTRTHVADLVDGFVAHSALEDLRTLAASLVDAAAIVERRPQSHPVWARAQVSWVADVTQLLDVGLLQLAEPEPAPVLPTSAELHRARVRRYRQRQREQRRSLGAGATTMAAQTGAGAYQGKGRSGGKVLSG